MNGFHPYRVSEDGSRTSICLKCFRTVGVDGKHNLELSEREHACAAADLLQRGWPGSSKYTFRDDNGLSSDASKLE